MTNSSGQTPAPAGRRRLSISRRLVPCLVICLAAATAGTLSVGTHADVALAMGCRRDSGAGSSTALRSRFDEGVNLLRSGDFDEAALVFRSIIEDVPTHTLSYVNLGAAYLGQERLPEAGRAFRRALSLDPESAAARVGLAQMYRLYREPRRAITELEKALELDPKNSEAAYLLAVASTEDGNRDKEFEALRLTVTIDPANSLAQQRLGDIYIEAGMYEEAIAAFRAAGRGRDPTGDAPLKLARAHYLAGDSASAEDVLRDEIARSPEDPLPRANLAQLLADEGRIAEARAVLAAAIPLATSAELRAGLERAMASLAE